MASKFKSTVPINSILAAAEDELNSINIGTVALKFEDIYNEFLNFIAHNDFKLFKDYISVLDIICGNLEKYFNLKRVNHLIRTKMYTKGHWGPIYWKFLHYTSILLQDLFSTKQIKNKLGFDIFIENLNYIILCAECKSHYDDYKLTKAFQNHMHLIRYGFIIEGVYLIHNDVTQQIYQRHSNHILNPLKQIHPPPSSTSIPSTTAQQLSIGAHHNPPAYFKKIDFAIEYQCLPLMQSHDLKIKDNVYELVDFQSPLHIHLSAILSIYHLVPFAQASAKLKSIYTISNIRNRLPTYPMIYGLSEAQFKNLPADTLKSTLHQLIYKKLEPDFRSGAIDKVTTTANMTLFEKLKSDTYNNHISKIHEILALKLNNNLLHTNAERKG